jgi:hypothetical protein
MLVTSLANPDGHALHFECVTDAAEECEYIEASWFQPPTSEELQSREQA